MPVCLGSRSAGPDEQLQSYLQVPHLLLPRCCPQEHLREAQTVCSVRSRAGAVLPPAGHALHRPTSGVPVQLQVQRKRQVQTKRPVSCRNAASCACSEQSKSTNLACPVLTSQAFPHSVAGRGSAFCPAGFCPAGRRLLPACRNHAEPFSRVLASNCPNPKPFDPHVHTFPTFPGG